MGAYEFLKNFFEIYKNFNGHSLLTHFLPWETLDPRFIDLKNATVDKLTHIAKERKEKYLIKLDYLRANRMIEEEEKLLDKLVKFYPDDSNFQTDKKNFRQRWARAIISRKAFESFDGGAEHTEPLFTEDELSAAKIFTTEIKKLAKKKPQLAYNLSIALYFLELYDLAHETLFFAPQALNVDWFSIEVLFRSRRYAQCLDAIAIVEKKYSDDPETVFGTTYYRALALDGLGQTGMAAELLKSIVTIRPTYRSAHSLLLKWGGRI